MDRTEKIYQNILGEIEFLNLGIFRYIICVINVRI